MATPAPEGYDFVLSWAMVEWILSAVASSGAGFAVWIWRLGSRVVELEARIVLMKDEEAMLRRTIRDLGNALDFKINEETRRLEGRLDRIGDKLDEFREELPSRSFIEGQLANLNGRLDRTIENKLNHRP